MSDYADHVIPFYGGSQPELFEIERRCMDRDGKVIDFLHERLPSGLVLDVGAGNGFTAARLSHQSRLVVPLEPDPLMVDRAKPLAWAKGVAQNIPFHDGVFDGAYSTWAFFFAGIAGIETGLAELNRVVKPGGPIIIVDNAGDDEFCALAPRPIHSDADWWRAHGFAVTIIETSFRFDSLDEARRMIAFYFGEEAAARVEHTEIGYRVAAYTAAAGSR